ncbi:hypothetical protein Q0R11_23910, partial [Escherichia coli :H21]
VVVRISPFIRWPNLVCHYNALLDQIQHYLMDHYQIEHATIQMEYQPCHGPDCHLNEGVSGHSHHHH